MCRNEANIHEISVPELNKKRWLKADAKKAKKTPEMTPKWVQKNNFILRWRGAKVLMAGAKVLMAGASATPQIVCPQRSQSASNDRKMN